MTVVAFDVLGAPAAQGSKRHVGRGIMVESSKRVRPWRDAVKAAAYAQTKGATPFPAGPVDVHITIYLPRPKAHYGTGRNSLHLKDNAPRHPAGTPDVDKVTRACFDAITDAGVWHDDSQASRVVADKQWAQDAGRPPGASITIQERH